MLKIGEKTLLETGVVEPGETLIMMAGRLSGIRIVELRDRLDDRRRSSTSIRWALKATNQIFRPRQSGNQMHRVPK